MSSKTPQFDKALDAILEKLTPHERVCRQCKQPFQIEKEDIDFYRMLRVPPPTLCPLCREKRRFGHLMRVPKFFKRPCNAPGHTEEIISVFPPASPHKVYDFSFYHSDSWEGTETGRDYDFNQRFFPQFRNLFFDSPHIALERDPFGVNCEYTLGGTHGKNNYYCSMAWHSEDCAYCIDVRFSRNLLDCTLMANSELCYKSVSSGWCNRCVWAVDCNSCLDSAFVYECKNCSHCFMSSNLRNKSYVWGNEQLTQQEYEKRIKEVNLGNRETFRKHEEEFFRTFERSKHRAVLTLRTVDAVGDNLMDCKNCYFAFRSQQSENLRYAATCVGSKDSMDVTNIAEYEKLYESVAALGGYSKFSMYIRSSSFLEYCSECLNCENCFGCVGLKNKKLHIFNRPFREEDYWPTLDKIKTRMLADGEYGEFFPLNLGLMPYQSSSGQYFFPLEQGEAERAGIPWYEEPTPAALAKTKPRPVRDIPPDIKDVGDSTLEEAILCEATGLPFRLIRAELDFYRRMNLPLPWRRPWQRMRDRLQFEHAVWLHPFTCPGCGEKSYSVYEPSAQEKLNLLCEKCYLREVV